jgi:hypothetical protein
MEVFRNNNICARGPEPLADVFDLIKGNLQNFCKLAKVFQTFKLSAGRSMTEEAILLQPYR